MFINLYSVKYYCKPHILIPRGHAHSFWSAPGNMTSGKVQHQTSVIHRLPITLHKLRIWNDYSQNWTFPEVAILGADQKERSLWGDTWCQTDKPTHVPDGNNNTMSDPARITPKIRIIDPNLQSLEFFQVVTNSRLFLLYHFSLKFIKHAKIAVCKMATTWWHISPIISIFVS